MGIMINTVRFAVDPSCVRGDTAVIDDEKTVHQITHVLRLRDGDAIVLFDGSGDEYHAVIRSITNEIVLSITEKRKGEREARMRITLYFSLLKSDKNDFVVQKCAELGVLTFFPLVTARTVVTSLSAAKRSRLTAIAREAAELSGGVYVPDVNAAVPFADALISLSSADTNVIAYEGESAAFITAHRTAQRLSVFIGPEGGFTGDEIALARERGVMPVSLGSRILRAETAAICAVAVLVL